MILELGDIKTFVSHMSREKTIKALANSRSFDIILSEYTHSLSNIKLINGILVVKPSELCSYLSCKATFAILDTKKMDSEIINL